VKVQRVKFPCTLLSTRSCRLVGSGGVAPGTFNICTGWSWVVGFIPGLLYPLGHSFRYPVDRKRCGWPPGPVWTRCKEKPLAPSGVEPRYSGRTTLILTTLLTVSIPQRAWSSYFLPPTFFCSPHAYVWLQCDTCIFPLSTSHFFLLQWETASFSDILCWIFIILWEYI
jgi:hypothetical protein